MPETEKTDETPATGATTTNTETTPPAESTLGDAGKKALDAERAARKAAEKAAAEYAAKVKEFEDAKKTDEERDAERLAAAEKAAAEATAKALRLQVAIEKGLPAPLVDRLTGSSIEELSADADVLLALVKPVDGGATPPPPGPLDGGVQPTDDKALTREQVAELARKDPKKLNELLDSGQIKLADLS